ncbi:RICIN domain-containing protein [Streptomyces inhibens]|nr:ricin-type beta-trefoil lectin domain protein [Streptomyces inhibens]
MRLALRLAVSAVVLALAAVSPASAADQQEPPDMSTVQLRQAFDHYGHKCLDSNAAGAAYMSPCNTNNGYQRWVWVTIGGPLVLRNEATNRCLDSDGNGNLYTSPCGSVNPYQEWNVLHRRTGLYDFENVSTHKCVASNFEGRAFTDRCDPLELGYWYVDEVS